MPHCVQCHRYFAIGGHSYSRCKECRHNPTTIVVNSPTPAYYPQTQTSTQTFVTQAPPTMSYSPAPVVSMNPYGAPMATTTTAIGPYGATTYMSAPQPTMVALPPQPMYTPQPMYAPQASYTTTSYAPAPYY